VKKYLEAWETKVIAVCVVSGILGMVCVHYGIPMAGWGIGVFSGIIIGYLPTERKVEDEQDKKDQ